jgi:hypothetical protein
MNLHELPINTTIVVADLPHINVTATRLSEETVEVIYKVPSTSTVVLNTHVDPNGNAQLVHFDKMFWSVTIDGRAATEKDLADLTNKPVRCKLDPLTRQMQIELPST